MTKQPNLIAAEVICDSITRLGFRMTTLKCVLPRIILAELNTHRLLTRNLASSRAIKAERAQKNVLEHPFYPIRYMKEHTGMQGTEYFSDQRELNALEAGHRHALSSAVGFAMSQTDLGLSKQITNRYFEPFQYVTALISATEWENFIALRASSQAEIHINDLAEKMLAAMNASTPKSLRDGEWHIPMSEDIDEANCSAIATQFYEPLWLADDHRWATEIFPEMIRLAAAGRLARISYKTLDEVGVFSLESDIKLAKRLIASGHWSPFEHIAQAMGYDVLHQYGHIEPWSAHRERELTNEIWNNLAAVLPATNTRAGRAIITYGWSGNIRGFVQYRKTFLHENRTDSRLTKKVWKDPDIRPADPVPTTFEEALDQLTADNPLALGEIRGLTEEEFMARAHHGMGRGIRNAWHLWWSPQLVANLSADNTDYPREEPPLIKWFNEQGLKHADDRSGLILRSWYRQLTGKPLEIDAQIQYYIAYWQKPENQH